MVFIDSFGVVTGRATIMAKQRLTICKVSIKTALEILRDIHKTLMVTECLQPGRCGCCKAAHNTMSENDCKVYATDDSVKLTKIKGRRKTSVLGLCLGCDKCLTRSDAHRGSDLDGTTPVDRGFIRCMSVGTNLGR